MTVETPSVAMTEGGSARLAWAQTGEWSVITDPDAAKIGQTFAQLAKQWRTATGASSFIARRIAHPAYRQIVKMGMPVVGTLIDELRRGKYEWIEALQEITKENPAASGPTLRGDRAAAAYAWTAWGKKKRF